MVELRDGVMPVLSKMESPQYIKHDGIEGLDLKNTGIHKTPYPDILKIIVTRDYVEYVPRGDGKSKKFRLQSEDPMAVGVWIDIRKRISGHGLRSGVKAIMKDGRPVYNLKIPAIDIDPVHLHESLSAYTFCKADYATEEEFLEELRLIKESVAV